MRKLAILAALVLGTTAAAVGFTVSGTDKTFTDCSSSGSAAQALTAGTYWARTTSTENVYLCLAASGSTCASGGYLFPPLTSVLIEISTDQLSASCRSAASTGDITLSLANR